MTNSGSTCTKNSEEPLPGQFHDLALLECIDSSSGEVRSVVCAVNRSGETFEFVPLAKLFAGDPYEEVMPPM